LPAEPALDFGQGGFEEAWDLSWTPQPERELLAFNPVTTFTRESSNAALHTWATKYGTVIHNLPWFQFHTLLHHRGMRRPEDANHLQTDKRH
jgi:hypothetical protein